MLTKMNEVMEQANAEAAKAAKGNKAAGVRLRAHMQTIKSLCTEVRKQVTEMKGN